MKGYGFKIPQIEAEDPKSCRDRIDDLREHDRHGAGRLQQRHHDRDATSQNDVGCERNQFRRLFANALGIAHGPAIFDARVAAVGPTKLLQALRESGEPGLTFRIVGGQIHEHADSPHALALLRARRERPRCGAAEQCDDLPPLHVWMAPAWQEIIWRAAQRSLAVMCPACWCSPGGLLALMGCANRVLIIQTGSMSR